MTGPRVVTVAITALGIIAAFVALGFGCWAALSYVVFSSKPGWEATARAAAYIGGAAIVCLTCSAFLWRLIGPRVVRRDTP